MNYVLFLARPGDSNKTKLLIRLVAGAWCVATFVMTNIYSNLLISYVTSPNPKPVLSSINDLANRPEIHVAVDTGYEYYIDPIVLCRILLITKTCFYTFYCIILFLQSDHVVVIKMLLTRIASHLSDSICSTSEECLAKVKKRSHIFVSVMKHNLFFDVNWFNLIKFSHISFHLRAKDASWLKFNVQLDFMKTKKCSFMMGKEVNLLTIPSSFIIKKNSPYLDVFNLGFV